MIKNREHTQLKAYWIKENSCENINKFYWLETIKETSRVLRLMCTVFIIFFTFLSPAQLLLGHWASRNDIASNNCYKQYQQWDGSDWRKHIESSYN